MPLPPLPNPQRISTRLLGLSRGCAAIAVLFTLLIIINAIQTASLLVRLFSGRAFRAINRGVAFFWIGLCVIWSEKLLGTKPIISGDDVPDRENAIVISNHQQMPDIPVSWMLARRKRRTGDVKYFVKDSLKYVPGLGWGMLFIYCIFVKRDWTRDREAIRQTFRKILTYQIPLWCISYVEGTRLRPEKLARSRNFAERHGLKAPRHIQLPRTRGLVATVQGLRTHASAVYDLTIGYVDGVPTLWQMAEGFVPVVHLHVRRFPIEELPREDQEISDWLFRRYEEKDELLEHYYRHGSFPPKS